ncbi:MAG: DUF362 domain-containing protein [Deltaproteobacteria bacterium]|nr:DUF362 domain-containing protein [Deltaproteobacteria bacterium]
MQGEKSLVYFADFRASSGRTIFDKIGELVELLNIGEVYKKGQLIGVKLHFGEKGNTAFVRPQFVRFIVDKIKETGASPFLTDTNTLYVGKRTNTVSHTRCAIENGFGLESVGAPIVIADGLRGESAVDTRVDGEICKDVSIAREVVSADGLFVVTHFKCHELTGFGGSLKNVGMGCASRAGKLMQHSGNPPRVDPEGCTTCGACALICPTDAIDIGLSAVINDDLCIGCSHCIAACPEGTIKVQWSSEAGKVQKKMIEHVEGALKGKRGKVFYINFINQVSPLCDCYGHTDAPIVPDIGILVSSDIVAIDQASVDLVNGEEGLPNTELKSGKEAGGDKFRGVHPSINWELQLEYAEERGLGSRDYTLEKI